MAVTQSEALSWAIDQFRGAIPEPVDLDARWLLEAVVGEALRSPPSQDLTAPLTPTQWSDFQAGVRRRATGEPLAYVIGEWEFFGLDFEVTPDVLVPRPETEHLVEWALELMPKDLPQRGLEVGVGSGCVVTTLAKERPLTQWIATDISEPALAVARRNGLRHQVEARVEWTLHDLADVEGSTPWRGDRFDLVVSNPPYIAPDDPELATNVAQFEPEPALLDVWERDGLGAYRRLASLAKTLLRSGGQLIVEVGNTQARDVAALFERAGFDPEVRKDLAGIDRLVGARLGKKHL